MLCNDPRDICFISKSKTQGISKSAKHNSWYQAILGLNCGLDIDKHKISALKKLWSMPALNLGNNSGKLCIRLTNPQ